VSSVPHALAELGAQAGVAERFFLRMLQTEPRAVKGRRLKQRLNGVDKNEWNHKRDRNTLLADSSGSCRSMNHGQEPGLTKVV